MHGFLSNVLAHGAPTALRSARRRPVSLKLPQLVRVIPARGEVTSRIPEGLQSVERRRRTRVAINPDSWPGSSSPFPLFSSSQDNLIEGSGRRIQSIHSNVCYVAASSLVVNPSTYSVHIRLGLEGYSDISLLSINSLFTFW